MNYIKQIADKYRLQLSFVLDFYNKVVDKQNFEFGIKMFLDGWITYDTVIRAQPINIADWQEKYMETRLRGISKTNMSAQF
ncbi:MAG: hypothetical protein PHX61_00675 [Alphaproteobacteria bacterium]|nr:hypothetical protein [Alphaproteobacteria bacterium]